MNYISFDSGLVNLNLVGQITTMNMDGAIKIVMFRADGSVLATETFYEKAEAQNRFIEIAEKVGC